MTKSESTPPIRLTHLSHGGGCGCKIAPAVLEKILADTPFSKGLSPAGRHRSELQTGVSLTRVT